MGDSSNSGHQGDNINFGSFTNNQNFSNLFGGTKTFNLGAGSSTNFIESMSFRNDNAMSGAQFAGKAGGGGGFGFDLAASVGVGVGGDGSAGAVEKNGGLSQTSDSSGAGGSIGMSPFMVGGIAIAGLLAAILIKRK